MHEEIEETVLSPLSGSFNDPELVDENQMMFPID